jgi:rare lipoprotein A
MKRNQTVFARHISIAALAVLALAGLGAAGRAEQADIARPALTATTGPAFVPGSDTRFADAFADIDGQADSRALAMAPAPGAVDMIDIEPAPPAPPEQAPFGSGSGRALGSGVASYYADMFNGRRTASGETFSNAALTAAHRTLPFGSRVKVTNPRTGASVVVRINDRGPFARGRTIDLSRAAAEQVGIVRAGHGTVELELIAG